MRDRCNIDETLTILMQTVMSINVFNVLISETLMVHSYSIDDSLIVLLKNIDETLMISVQTLMIIFFMLHQCVLAKLLIKHEKFREYASKIIMNKLRTFYICFFCIGKTIVRKHLKKLTFLFLA